VILLMPSDVIIQLTVGVNLVHIGAGLLAALPFIAATVLVAALPCCSTCCSTDAHRALRPRYGTG
jgi:hypothetical protein